MISNSHKRLGKFLAKEFLPHITPLQKKLFMLGCVQPDKNPTTYLKGSMNHSPYCGHNWSNARLYIFKLIRNLQTIKDIRIYDYYKMGKLIHYLADAFTFTHNRAFQGSLALHRTYEQTLDQCLRETLSIYQPGQVLINDLSSYIETEHNKYLLPPFTLEKDAECILNICCQTMHHLTSIASSAASSTFHHEFCI